VNVMTGDLLSSLGQVGIYLGVLALAGIIAFWRSRRRGSRTLFLDVALALGGWWVALSFLGAVGIVLKAFTTDWVEISGAPFSVPFPADLPCHDAGAETGPTAPALSCGTASLSHFTVAGSTFGVHLLAAAAQICLLVASTIPAALIAVISFQTLRGRAFHRTVVRTLIVAAISLLILGLGGGLLNDVAAALALREVFAPGSHWDPGFPLTVNLLPVGGAIALAALAAVFHQGMWLQDERDRLQEDTEGLV